METAVIMQVFYDLAEDETQCTTAIQLLIDELQSSSTDSLEYCWKRLVKGMPSTRKNARLGFAVALSEVLHHFSTISSEEVYSVCKETNLPSGNLNSKETRDSYAGFTFCVSSLHKSGRLQNHEFCIGVLKEFVPIVLKEKLTIKDVTFRVLVDILDDMKNDKLADVVSLLSEELKKGWVTCSAERLALLSYFEKRDVSLVSRILKKNWNFSHLHHPQNYEKIAEVLKSIFCEEFIKPQLSVILDCCTSSGYFKLQKASKNFLTILGSGENKNTVMFIMTHFINSVSESKLEAFVNKSLLEILKKPFISSPKSVHNLTKCLSERITLFKSSETKLSFIKSMLSLCPGRNSCLHQFLDTYFNKFAPDNTEQYIMLLENFIIEPNQNEKNKAITEFRNDCLSWAMQITKHMNTKEVFEFTKFLFIYSYFEVKGECKEFPQVKTPNPSFSQETTSFCKIKFNSCLKVLTTNSQNIIKKQKGVAEDGRYWVYHLMSCSLLLVTNEKFPMICDITTFNEWTNLWSVIDEIEAKPLESRSSEDWAFELLFLHCGILFFDEQEQIKVILNDAHQCYEKQKAKSNDDWKNILVDLLISILSYESLMLRNMACECFRLICNNLEKDAIQIIMNALESSDKDEEETEMADESSSDSDCSENNESAADSSESADDSSESDNENGTNENDEINAIINENSESDESLDLGENDDDSDDVNLSDADEEVLSKEDKVLGSAMRGLLNIKKEKQLEKKEKASKKIKMIHFKVKILDFVEIIIKDVGFSTATMNILPGLLKLVASASVTSGPVYNKVVSIFKNLLSVKSDKLNVDLDEEVKPDIVQIQELIIKSSNKKAQDLSIQTLFLLCKVYLSNCEPKVKKRRLSTAVVSDEDQVYSIFSGILKDFVTNKNTKVNKSILFQMIERFPIIRSNLVTDVTSYIDGDITIYAKMQGIALLQRVLSFSDKQCDDWQKKILLSVKNLLTDLLEKKTKSPHNIRECLKLCIKLHSIQSKLDLKVELLDTDMKSVVEAVAISEMAIKFPDIVNLSRKVINIFG